MPDNGEIQTPTVTADLSAQPPIVETRVSGTIGPHTVVPARSVLEAISQDNPNGPSVQNDSSQSVAETHESSGKIELLQSREYPLLAQGLKARTIQTLAQMKNSIQNDPDAQTKLQTAIDAIKEQDPTHVGNRSTLGQFITTLAATSQDEGIQATIETITTSTRALATNNQTADTVALACQHLHLVSPHSISGVLNRLEGTFMQRAQTAVQDAARELYHQNRALSAEQEKMITAGVLEPYVSRIEGRHILSPADLQELINLAENTAISNPTAVENARKNESLAQIKIAMANSVQEYQTYLSGAEQTPSWNNTGTEAMAEAITNAIETESNIEIDTELKQAEHKRRVQKIKTTSMLLAVLVGMLIYSSIPKGEQ